jgi:hypothetical protein
MVGRGHTKEIIGLLNVWYDHDLPSNRVLKCIEIHLTTQRFLSYDLDLPSKHLNTLFDGKSWSYKRTCGVVKCKLYIFKHPLRW